MNTGAREAPGANAKLGTLGNWGFAPRSCGSRNRRRSHRFEALLLLAGRQLADPNGNGVIYANHAYDNKNDTVAAWIAKMEQATAKLPVIVSEFGGRSGPARRGPPGDNWLLHVLQALQDHNWAWTAWDLHPRAGPTLISDHGDCHHGRARDR